jgi:hypothetical protein
MRSGYVYRNMNNGETTTFTSRQSRLDRLSNWELVSEPAGPPAGGETTAATLAPAWAEQPSDAERAATPQLEPQPDPVGAQLVVITTPPRRARRGSPPATVKGSKLDPDQK